MEPILVNLPVEGYLPPFDGATEWINSPPLTRPGLLGKVVAVDFCTYTCINWIRTLPYLRAWAEKYRDDGLVVIGVHTPEFSVEKKAQNVRRALSGMGVEYAVVMDNDHVIWDAFGNRYWPALYLGDAHGRIRHHWFGEGDYERSEAVIQQLLIEAGAADEGRDFVSAPGVGAEAPADWDNLQSAETYLGYGRGQRFTSPGSVAPDQPHVYARPDRLSLNEWALWGEWTVRSEGAILTEPAGGIAFRFHARDVNLVMGPVEPSPSIRFRVSIDGRPPGGDARGSDVDASGAGRLDQPRMYQLIRQRGPIIARSFEIAFLDQPVEVFVFTFG
jgi:hypothetical protein